MNTEQDEMAVRTYALARLADDLFRDVCRALGIAPRYDRAPLETIGAALAARCTKH